MLHKVALIQISSADCCFLFRLNEHGIFPALVELMTNPEILKIGLSLHDDFHNIRRRLKFEPQGFIDLQNIVGDYGIEEMSLTKIYAILFCKKISKSQRLTNWEADCLTELQKRYAALDAWACLKIYEKLCTMPKSVKSA
jgi:ribonuclease D